MKRALIGVGLLGLLVVAVSLLAPGCGGGDYTPCEIDLDCLIICDCANGADAIVGPFPCRAGNCGMAHADRRDCFEDCSRLPPPGQVDDDDSGLNDDDDSGLNDDDDSGSPADDDDSAR